MLHEDASSTKTDPTPTRKPTRKDNPESLPRGRLARDDLVGFGMSSAGRISVFAGASAAPDSCRRAAKELVAELESRKLGLVYGGASVGLMGVLADAALDAGIEVIGVIPAVLVEREIAHQRLTELVVVENMHARKAKMLELCSAFVALPGGFGTLDELFEVTTWAQLGLHRRPIGLLDVDDYFRPLLAFVENAVSTGFVRAAASEPWVVGRNAKALLAQLLDH